MVGENCLLLDVRSPGAVDAYGDAAAAGDSVWTGRIAGHLRRRRVLSFGSGLATVVETDELVIRLHKGLPVDRITSGDRNIASTVLVEDQRVLPVSQRRFRVAGAVVSMGGGTVADSIRMQLADGD